MNWMITESHNIPLILCGIFYIIILIVLIINGIENYSV